MIEIRKITTDDVESFIKLRNLVWRDAYKHIFPEEVFLDRERNEEKSIAFVKTWDLNANGAIHYMAEDNGRMVGFMIGNVHSQYAHFEDYADLNAVYIHPDYQGKGIGTKFFNIFVEEMRNLGATKFVIGVLKDNKKARRVYERWGGKLDSRTQPFEKLGKLYDEVFYTFEI